MQLSTVEKQIDRDRVLQRYLHQGLRYRDLDVFAFYALNIQILYNLEDIVTNLLVGIVIHDAEARHFLHLVLQLVFGYVGRHELEGQKDSEHEDDGKDYRFELAFAALGTVAPRYRIPFRGALKIHENLLREPPMPARKCGIKQQNSAAVYKLTLAPCPQSVETLPHRVFPECYVSKVGQASACLLMPIRFAVCFCRALIRSVQPELFRHQ
jgi:hypothetical protein